MREIFINCKPTLSLAGRKAREEALRITRLAQDARIKRELATIDPLRILLKKD